MSGTIDIERRGLEGVVELVQEGLHPWYIPRIGLLKDRLGVQPYPIARAQVNQHPEVMA